jgi:hypothetical protein
MNSNKLKIAISNAIAKSKSNQIIESKPEIVKPVILDNRINNVIETQTQIDEMELLDNHSNNLKTEEE